MVYAINETVMDKLELKLKKIQKKCEKYGFEFKYEKKGEEFRKVRHEDNYSDTFEKFYLVEASGTAKIDGWEFIATIEHTELGNVIRSFQTKIAVPLEYREVKSKCDHCKTNRARKDTYLVMNESGEFLQLGKTCLMDYTHALDAESVTAYLSLFDELEAHDGCSEGGTGIGRYIYRDDYMRIACEMIRLYGFVSYAKSQEFGWTSTVNRVDDVYFPSTSKQQQEFKKELHERGFDPGSETVKTRVAEVLAWAQSLDSTADYLWNLKMIANKEFLDFRDVGILVSAFAAYDRYLGIEYEKKNHAKSEYLAGKIGDKVEIDIDQVKLLTSFQSDYGGNIGVYKFISHGNSVIWTTSAFVEVDKVKKIKGTIKEFKDYKGEKETVLTRCKVIERG
jgi:hypothetical protein